MTSKLDIQSKTLHHKKIQKETQNSSIVDQNLLIDPFSNLNGKCKIHDNNLENNIRDLKQVIDMTQSLIVQLKEKFSHYKDSPPPIYYEEHRELQDRLEKRTLELNNLQNERDDLIRRKMLDSNQGDTTKISTAQPVEGAINNHIQNCNSSKNQQKCLIENRSETIGGEKTKPKTIKLLLPNGAGHIKAIQGNSLKEVILRSPRLKKLRDNPDQLTLYVCGTQNEVDMNTDSMNFVGSELELRTNHEAYNENTRIPQAKHKFEGISFRTFFQVKKATCDFCNKRLMSGITCKMCGFKLHEGCRHKVQDYCITRQQIIELEKKNIIGMAKSSPDEIVQSNSHQEWPSSPGPYSAGEFF